MKSQSGLELAYPIKLDFEDGRTSSGKGYITTQNTASVHEEMTARMLV